MAYRLGVDLGTASIGIALIELVQLEGKLTPVCADEPSVRIFSEPLESASTDGVNQTLNKARGSARRTRRLIGRRSGRHREIARLAPLLGLAAHEVPSDDGQSIHALRAGAVSARIPLGDMLNVFLKMSKRRGYKGRFKSQQKADSKTVVKQLRKTAAKEPAEKKEVGTVEPGINQLRAKMLEAQCETLGQYLAYRYEHHLTLRLKTDGLYAHRDMLRAEFDAIWNEQSKHHSVLSTEHKGKPLREIFRATLLDQNPLRSPAAMVGNCSLEKNLPRAPRAQPWAQSFRIEKQIADLRWGGGRRAEALSLEQRCVIRDALRDQKEATFDSLYRRLESAGCPDHLQRSLNLERSSRDKLSVDTTRAAWRRLHLIDAWDELDELTQTQVINFLADLGSPEQLDEDDWPTRFVTAESRKPRRFSAPMIGFVDRVRKHPDFDRLSAMGFEGARSAYSLRALKRLTQWLQNPPHETPRVDEDAAIQAIYKTREGKRHLQRVLTMTAATGNVVVDVALRQLHGEINRIIELRGEPPAQIIVEMSRNMGLGPQRRGDIEKKIKDNKNARDNAAKDIYDHNKQIASALQIHRYLLWKDQDKKWCPYCNDPINVDAALSGHETNIEHILPRKLTRVGGKRSQLVLAHRSCNDAKGDKTPHQAFGHIPERWDAVKRQADRFENKRLFGKAKLLRLEEWDDEDLSEPAIKEFTDRQFHETSWISKLAALWLRDICPDVSISRGEMTAYQRRVWGLDTVIAEVRYEEGLPVKDTNGELIARDDFDKFRDYWEGHENRYKEPPTERRIDKRIDHRHHYIDALVIALTDREAFRLMAMHYKACAEKQKAGEKIRLSRYVNPAIPDIRAQALALVRRLRIEGLTHKANRHAEGKLFDDNPRAMVCSDNKQVLSLRQTLATTLATDADLKTVNKLIKTVTDAVARQKLALTVKEGVADGLTPVEALARPAQKLAGRERLADWAKDNKLTAETARKWIADIVSEDTRERVSDAFESRLANGLTPQQAFAEDILHSDYLTPIKRVLMFARKDGIPIRHHGRSGEHVKYLVSNEYAYLEVCMTDISIEPRLIERVKAMRNARSKLPGWERFWKNDTVRFETDGQLYLVKKLDNRDKKLICIRHTETAPNVDYVKKAEGRREFAGDNLRKLTVVNHVRTPRTAN